MKQTAHNTKYIILAGGLSGGPIKPLLAIAKYWQEQDANIVPVIIDVKNSVSKSLAQDEGYLWHRIITGKIRRYWSFWNIISPFMMFIGFIQAFVLLRKYKPIMVLGAGGFAQTPLIVMAWILRIPKLIHQQDVLVTLSNRLCAPFANIITTTFEFSIRDFHQGTGLGMKYITGTKVFWTGNPTVASKTTYTKSHAKKHFGLHDHLPTLLVFGGGTGSAAINQIIVDSLPELTKVVQVLHITGIGKGNFVSMENYHSLEFADEMGLFYSASDIVLARAGLGTLTELAEYGRPSIIVPMPKTHQELNAELLYRTKSALVLDQEDLDGQILINAIRKILFNHEYEKTLTHNIRAIFPKHADQKVVHLIQQYLKKHE